jgi:RimJ/RimL family protein N-acetyltransferase
MTTPSPDAHTTQPVVLTTERLLLRQWRDTDRAPFAALTADPVVMRHFPATMTREASDTLVDRLAAGITGRGWGFWAVEVRSSGKFAGFVGLQPLSGVLPFAPGVELGWRLAAAYQGLGYATEAARASARFGFDELGLEELVAFTTERNRASRRVMDKLGMIHNPAEDFEHPGVPADWPERFSVLYRLPRPR